MKNTSRSVYFGETMIARNPNETFCYTCTGDAEHLITQEVHLIAGNYFFCSKVKRPEDGNSETMIFQCTESGSVTNWCEEWCDLSDKELREVVKDFAQDLLNPENKENHDG